jgi:GntR family transcriptional regulator
LERDSNVPLYFQLGGVLKEKVDSGAWQPGDRFPTEREIAEEFDVSRTVIRAALDLLVGDGGIMRIKGSGAFVAPPRREASLIGVVQALLEPTEELTLTIFSAREESPDATVAQFLQLEKRPAPIVQVTAVINVEEQPLCLVQSYSVSNLVPWLLPSAEALQSGTEPPKPGKLELDSATVSIELTFFGHWGGPRLGASAGDPALMARLVQFGKARGMKRSRPIEFAYLICPSDSARFAFQLN